MKNEFLIYVKLIKINPETGAAFVPICEMQPQFAVNLYYYIHDFQRKEDDNSQAYQSAIEEILRNLYSIYQCPLGWLIEMRSTDEFLARLEGKVNPFYKTEKRFSQDFLYSPEHGETKIDLEFMYRWVLESIQTFKAGD